MYDAPPESPFEVEAPVQPNPLEGVQTFLKEHGKTILIAIVALVALYLVYDFFIGSQVNVTITAKDTEGRILSTMSGALYESGAASPMQRFEGSLSLGLRPGSYRVEWDAADSPYVPPEPQDIFVEKNPEMQQDETTVFVKDLGVVMVSFDFPSAIVRGQQGAKGLVKLKNNTTSGQTVNLVLGEGLAVFKDSITFEPSTITVPPKTTLDVYLTIDVPDTLAIVNKNTGDKKTGTIRIQFTEEEIEKSFTQYYSFTYDLTPRQTIIINAKADEQRTARFTLGSSSSNETNEKINAQVLITQTDDVNPENAIKSWFTWAVDPPFTPPKKGE